MYILLFLSVNAISQPKGNIEIDPKVKNQILESKELLDFETAYKAYDFQNRNKNKFAMNLIKLKLKKEDTDKQINDYYYILRELNDNQKEKLVALKLKIRDIDPLISEELLYEIFQKLTLSISQNNK